MTVVPLNPKPGSATGKPKPRGAQAGCSGRSVAAQTSSSRVVGIERAPAAAAAAASAAPAVCIAALPPPRTRHMPMHGEDRWRHGTHKHLHWRSRSPLLPARRWTLPMTMCHNAFYRLTTERRGCVRRRCRRCRCCELPLPLLRAAAAAAASCRCCELPLLRAAAAASCRCCELPLLPLLRAAAAAACCCVLLRAAAASCCCCCEPLLLLLRAATATTE